MLIRSISLPILLGVLASAPAHAMDVYRWVDENGTVHFSQWEPAAAGTPVETVRVDEGTTAGIGGDVYPIAEQAEAMAALWAEIEQQRANRQKQRQEPAPAAIPYHEDDHAIWPVWDAGRPHPRPPFPPRPRPPEIVNPPSLPYRPPGDSPGFSGQP